MIRIHSVYGFKLLFLGLFMGLLSLVRSTVVHWVCCIGKSMKCSNHRKGRAEAMLQESGLGRLQGLVGGGRKKV
jgi:hypothetical protein